MALADYEELAARSFEEPGDPELRAAILVCADALSQIDDPRGPLIAMEHALHDAERDREGARRALELRRAMHEYAAGHLAGPLGGAGPLLHAGRTLALEWRSGLLYGISIDARYLPVKSKEPPSELVRIVLEAPAASQLRRLRVRVRTEDDVANVDSLLRVRSRSAPPLEEVEIYTNVWPATLSGLQRLPPSDRLANVYYLVHGTTVIALPPTGDLQCPPARAIPDVLSSDPPTTPEGRRILGRAITHGDPDLRRAGLERIATFGPRARCFERVLCALLQPQVATSDLAWHTTSRPLIPIIDTLRALGPSLRASRVLQKVASRPGDYDQDTRNAAGAAAVELRPGE